MRALLISPWFPPWPRVGSKRPARFAAGLAARGHQVAVVHLAHRGPVPPELKDVLRFPIGVPRDPAAVSGRRRSHLAERVDRAVPIDGWLPVLGPALPRVLRFARDFEPDVVWSTADPWSSLLVGQQVAARLGRPWVADLRDPWTPCRVRHARRPAWTRAVDRWTEAHLLPRAERVVLTAERTAARYEACFPSLRGRTRVIRNGYPGEAMPFERSLGTPGPLTLRFFGRFRPLSSARWAIAAAAASGGRGFVVRSVEGLDADDADRAQAAGVRGLFEAEPAVASAEGRARLRSSDVLLLSTEPERDEIVPAKFYDYLAAGRPILALTDSPEVKALVEGCGVGIVFSSVEAAGRWIDEAVAAKAQAAELPGPFRPDPAAIAAHQGEVGVEALEALLLDCASMRSARATRAASKAERA